MSENLFHFINLIYRLRISFIGYSYLITRYILFNILIVLSYYLLFCCEYYSYIRITDSLSTEYDFYRLCYFVTNVKWKKSIIFFLFFFLSRFLTIFPAGSDQARWEQINLIYNEVPECNVAGESLIATLVDGDN